jgi:AcrR family transcriptional regulator
MSIGCCRGFVNPWEDGTVATPAAADGAPAESLEIRPPVQRRSREAWERVLNAGVELLEEGGYDAFTIAAVCERAHVAPRAIYARADNKDALFLAVYEHGMTRLRADQAVLMDEERWRGLPADQLAIGVVGEVAAIFFRHAALLRAVVLISGVHQEVYRRGAYYSRQLGDLVTNLLLLGRDAIDSPDPATAARAAFNAVFSALVLRVAYGPTFAAPLADDQIFLETLSLMVRRYLFR